MSAENFDTKNLHGSNLDAPVTRRECVLYRELVDHRMDSLEVTIQEIHKKLDAEFAGSRTRDHQIMIILIIVIIGLLTGKWIDIGVPI